MYYLKCDGVKTRFRSVRSAKREGDEMIACGAFDAFIYSGNIPYAYRRFDSHWKRIYHTPTPRSVGTSAAQKVTKSNN